jgi:flagellar protein FlaF
MSATGMQAYRNVQKVTIKSEREIDAYALTQCALKLWECQQNWSNMTGRERIDRMFAALSLNSKLWSIYQAEISRDGNPLPKKVREDILSLSLFVDKRTKEVMCSLEPEKLTILIDINQNLAAGLSASMAQNKRNQSASHFGPNNSGAII